MAFRFPLAPVLKLRESLEERELHLLEYIQHEIARTVHLLEDLRSQRRVALTARERELAGGAVAADLHFSEQVRRCQQEHEQSLEAKLAELQLRRKQQMDIDAEAKRKRQMLSELREKQQAEHDAKLAHATQRQADDSFLARFRRG